MATNIPDMFRMGAGTDMGQTAVGILVFALVGFAILMFFNIRRDLRMRRRQRRW